MTLLEFLFDVDERLFFTLDDVEHEFPQHHFIPHQEILSWINDILDEKPQHVMELNTSQCDDLLDMF